MEMPGSALSGLPAGISLVAPSAIPPPLMLARFHLASRSTDLLMWHRISRVDWPLDLLEMRLLSYVTTGLVISDGKKAEPVLHRAGRAALTAYGKALSQSDTSRLRALVGGFLAAITELLLGIALESPQGKSWSPANGRALSVWLKTAGPIDKIRVVAGGGNDDPAMLQLQLMRQCLTPDLRRILTAQPDAFGTGV